MHRPGKFTFLENIYSTSRQFGDNWKQRLPFASLSTTVQTQSSKRAHAAWDTHTHTHKLFESYHEGQ